MSNSTLFSEVFKITKVNPDGKAFEKVTRFAAETIQYDISILIDINTDVYPLRENDTFTLVLTNTINKDGSPDSGTYVDVSQKETLLDQYEYCMYGKVFKYEYKGNNKVLIYISFGGLLMSIEGDQRYLVNIKYGDRLYLLMRKMI
ncbi:hypothetical protein WA158_006325 [Blastocystis sp. Blastoise]